MTTLGLPTGRSYVPLLSKKQCRRITFWASDTGALPDRQWAGSRATSPPEKVADIVLTLWVCVSVFV